MGQPPSIRLPAWQAAHNLMGRCVDVLRNTHLKYDAVDTSE